MEVKIREIIDAVVAFAPETIQESWDNSGLMVGNIEGSTKKVLLALDCTEETVQEAEEFGANLIITHHPLLFKGLKQIGDTTYVERVVKRLIKSDVTLYSVHTNLDKVPNGVSGIMADKLSLIEREILSTQDENSVGLGIVGNLPAKIHFTELIELVKKHFGRAPIKTSKPLEGAIGRVALCGGSGSSLIPDAMKSGAEVFITGDISYHHFFTEEGFMVMDIGHYESEVGVLELLREIILKKMANFAVRISKKSNNPIHYH